jgi:acetoin utilization deacetylase AcuC-like enzyme
VQLKVVFDPLYMDHQTGAGHPERAERLAAFVAGLEAGGLSRSTFVLPKAADVAAIAAVHPEQYVSLVERVCQSLPPSAIGELPTGDTIVSRESFPIALAAAGGALAAVSEARVGAPALAVIRPPGHHAEPERGMGFCVFNNIAVAAAWALRERGDVLIADFDYHHGNGTQAWVERALRSGERGLGFISTHAYPAYPGTGAFGESQMRAEGFVVDIPLPHSTDTHDFVAVWSSLLPVLAARLRPKTILVSAGFDFLAGDPIAGLPVAPRAVDALCGLLGDVANRHDAALAFILEGGYSLDNLRASGSSLAYDFGKHAPDVHVPQAEQPHDERLRAMTAEAASWCS